VEQLILHKLRHDGKAAASSPSFVSVTFCVAYKCTQEQKKVPKLIKRISWSSTTQFVCFLLQLHAVQADYCVSLWMVKLVLHLSPSTVYFQMSSTCMDVGRWTELLVVRVIIPCTSWVIVFSPPMISWMWLLINHFITRSVTYTKNNFMKNTALRDAFYTLAHRFSRATAIWRLIHIPWESHTGLFQLQLQPHIQFSPWVGVN